MTMGSAWSHFTDTEHIYFFLGGVVLSGIASGVCSFLKERRRQRIKIQMK